MAGAGIEWVVEASGCEPARLCNLAHMRALIGSVVEDLGLRVIGEPQWHAFGGPAGVTGMYLLSESHLCCHTYPEFSLATFNLYCCGSHGPWPWEERLRDSLRASRVTVRTLERGP